MIVVGSALYAIRSYPLSYNPATGKAQGIVYEGLRESLEAIILTLDTSYPYRLDDSQAPLCRLEVHTPDSSDLAVTFELVGNSEQKSIFEHPRSLDVATETIGQLRDKTTEERIELLATLTGDAKWLCDYLIHGSDSYTEDQFVFRITQVVTRNSVVAIGVHNTQEIYSTSQLITETNPTGAILAALIEIDSNPVPLPVLPGYAYGWKKGTPTFQQIGFNRFAITLEYIQAVWSMYPYNLSDTAGSAAPNVPFA